MKLKNREKKTLEKLSKMFLIIFAFRRVIKVQLVTKTLLALSRSVRDVVPVKTNPRGHYVNELISFPSGTLHSLSWVYFLLALLIFHAVGIKQDNLRY